MIFVFWNISNHWYLKTSPSQIELTQVTMLGLCHHPIKVFQIFLSPFSSVSLTKIVSFMDISSHSSKNRNLPNLNFFPSINGYPRNTPKLVPSAFSSVFDFFDCHMAFKVTVPPVLMTEISPRTFLTSM